MNFREQIGLSVSKDAKLSSDSWLWKEYGILCNPFPASHQTTGHPRSLDEVDETIVERLKQFFSSGNSQTVMIEGTQGTGKTNLLNHYQQELSTVAAEEEGFYVVRYYPNPEPQLDELLRQIIQELGVDHLGSLATALSKLDDIAAEQAIQVARNPDFRSIARRLRAAEDDEDELDTICAHALEWLTGLRIYKRHVESLGVHFRLDTTEARIQGLHDLVMLSGNLKVLKGVFLLLDELEKQDDLTLSVANIVRYLGSLRALIDALPRYRFLMLAITPTARGKYFRLYPALASRLQTSILAFPVFDDVSEAKKLYSLYLENEQARAKGAHPSKSQAGSKDLFSAKRLDELFALSQHTAQRRQETLTPRAWLNRLHNEVEAMIKQH